MILKPLYFLFFINPIIPVIIITPIHINNIFPITAAGYPLSANVSSPDVWSSFCPLLPLLIMFSIFMFASVSFPAKSFITTISSVLASYSLYIIFLDVYKRQIGT